jgi:hypothetical protein
MTDRLHEVLSEYASDYSIGERLHAVPPYL